MIGGEFLAIKEKYEIKYKEIFEPISSDLNKVSVFISNLETTLQKSNAPRLDKSSLLYSPPESLSALKQIGCNVVSIANNHITDFGLPGFKKTTEILTKENFLFFGAGGNVEEAVKPLILHIEDQIFAFIAFTTNENHVKSILAKDNETGCAPLDEKYMISSISEAKKVTNNICVIFHWGYEYFRLPSPKQRKIAKLAIDSGAKSVIGHHPHVIQGIEWYKNCPIVYSLGNFFFPDFKHSNGKGMLHTWENFCRIGLIAIVDFYLDENIKLRIIPIKDQKTDVIIHNNSSKIFNYIEKLSCYFQMSNEKYEIIWSKYKKKKEKEISKKNHMVDKRELGRVFREMGFLRVIPRIRIKTIIFLVVLIKNEVISRIMK